jgi:hypothetical protein
LMSDVFQDVFSRNQTLKPGPKVMGKMQVQCRYYTT